MMTGTADPAFVEHLHAEKLRTQENRTKYVTQKLAFVTGLMSLGSLSIGGSTAAFDFGYLLLLAPWVATAFDLYILGEDYSVKRTGAFLRAQSPSGAERTWEAWVSRHRDHFAPVAMPLLTTIVLVGSIAITAALRRVGAHAPVSLDEPLTWVWYAVTLLPCWFLYVYYRRLKGRIEEWAAVLRGDQITPFAQLAARARRSDHILDDATYRMASRLYKEIEKDRAVLEGVHGAHGESTQAEVLLCVDRQGEPVAVSDAILKDYRRRVARMPDYGRWFQEAALPNGQRTLLVARWLSHAAGLRHRSVHLFLDHPVLHDHTLLQVRGFTKAEAPGLLDLPAAGHVSGLDTVDVTLDRELQEELGLTLDAVEDLTKLGDYDYTDGRDAEYRSVYRGRLKSEDLLRLSGDDDEVAAVATVSVKMVESTLAQHPERYASGLRGSFAMYREARNGPDC